MGLITLSGLPTLVSWLVAARTEFTVHKRARITAIKLSVLVQMEPISDATAGVAGSGLVLVDWIGLRDVEASGSCPAVRVLGGSF